MGILHPGAGWGMHLVSLHQKFSWKTLRLGEMGWREDGFAVAMRVAMGKRPLCKLLKE